MILLTLHRLQPAEGFRGQVFFKLQLERVISFGTSTFALLAMELSLTGAITPLLSVIRHACS